MSYQVLARKWRPQNFHQLVGQQHVKQALVNALDQNRLHHAYLFTGTRGVGKTTIARIFAKSLNCESGITSQPCGSCNACVDIEQGRFIDLIEIDAASRTKVEDTREILDNVQYAPTRGRYKVYLIDEVHMLSKHSFNALLKTLEEPPEHVKFLLATTDPQKLPVTILSRCLQFNLAALSENEIETQLTHILQQEQLGFEPEALKQLAQSAKGSMRDALSLTDQAIAQTNGNISHQATKQMLGLMDITWAQSLLIAAMASDGDSLLELSAKLGLQNGNYGAVLDDLIKLCHLILVSKLVPSAAQLSDQYADFISELANEADTREIQVYYQLLLNGKKDLMLAPTEQLGFEMVMLKLLAFEPAQMQTQAPAQQKQSAQTQPQAQQATPSARVSLKEQLKKQKEALDNKQVTQPQPEPVQSVVEKPAPLATATEVTAPQVQTAPVQSQEQHSQEQPSQEQLEQQVNQQMDDVLAQAEQLTSQSPAPEMFEQQQQQQQMPEQVVNEQPPVEESPQPSFEQNFNNEAEAIAKILARRNVSGSGSLIQPDGSETSIKKTEPQQRGEHFAKPKQSPLEKYRGETQHVAPELIEQLTPEPKQEEAPAPEPQVIEGFESPISQERFAHQQDDWANKIETMGLGGRVRQFALHSIYQQNGAEVSLLVDSEQRHLDSPMLREQLQQALSNLLNTHVELIINFNDMVEQTPFRIQQKIDAFRHQQAVHTIKNDPIITQLMTHFDAELDEGTIKAL
ncbi:DNA polymerase III subunit gamma/tau [Pseudoalteromonas spongiae]|uniref:DNA polymerase III subunit gamma/tau n=1 Tax=Pseudoalteromonas spongiae TaxID=298657 RepID=UPI00110B8E45|nr:DNA polymerase III subunit gamma/tau [Pseudoalteromonas spongiae]TMO86148.1 AAA family ATPase [Pseudoalteromonas spongiae]